MTYEINALCRHVKNITTYCLELYTLSLIKSKIISLWIVSLWKHYSLTYLWKHYNQTNLWKHYSKTYSWKWYSKTYESTIARLTYETTTERATHESMQWCNYSKTRKESNAVTPSNKITTVRPNWWWWQWLLLYSAILCSRADSLCLHVILHEWLAFYSMFFYYPPKWCTYSAGMAGATWNYCHLGTSSVYTIQPCTMSLHAKAHM